MNTNNYFVLVRSFSRGSILSEMQPYKISLILEYKWKPEKRQLFPAIVSNHLRTSDSSVVVNSESGLGIFDINLNAICVLWK